jgi:hypothetical protein
MLNCCCSTVIGGTVEAWRWIQLMRRFLSQPPGFGGEAFRTTEQGEMISFKFGLPDIAGKTSTFT